MNHVLNCTRNRPTGGMRCGLDACTGCFTYRTLTLLFVIQKRCRHHAVVQIQTWNLYFIYLLVNLCTKIRWHNKSMKMGSEDVEAILLCKWLDDINPSTSFHRSIKFVKMVKSLIYSRFNTLVLIIFLKIKISTVRNGGSHLKNKSLHRYKTLLKSCTKYLENLKVFSL